MAGTPIKVGIVGCGGMGNAHVKAVQANLAFELVAVCDVNPDAFKGVAAEVPRYTTAADLLREHKLDLATLVLPNFLYEPTVELAAKHGVNVLCEKPLGHNLASCQRMIDTAQAHGIRGWVSSQRKYLPQFIAARNKLETLPVDFISVIFTYYWPPAFGAMGWRGDRQKSGGIALIDSGWHVFDALHWLMGEPESVFAQLTHSRQAADIDEKAAIQLRYPSGALANLTISYATPKNTFEFIFTAQDKAVEVTYELMNYFEDGQLKETVAPKESGDLVGALYAELLTSMREPESKAYITSLDQGLAIMRVIDACYRSAASGQIVRLGA